MELDRLRGLLSPHLADLAAWEAALASGVHMRVGSASPVLGKKAVLACLAAVLAAVQHADSKMGQFWKVREALFAELVLHWRDNDRVALVPCFLVLRARADLIEDLRLYCDLSPVSGAGRFGTGSGGGSTGPGRGADAG